MATAALSKWCVSRVACDNHQHNITLRTDQPNAYSVEMLTVLVQATQQRGLPLSCRQTVRAPDLHDSGIRSEPDTKNRRHSFRLRVRGLRSYIFHVVVEGLHGKTSDWLCNMMCGITEVGREPVGR